MSTRLQMQAKPVPITAQSFTPVRSGLVRRRSVDRAGLTAVPPVVHEALSSTGQPLETDTRGLMESRFGHDFSRVRVHADAKATESARAVNALAYTFGPDIVFGAGQYAPGTGDGKRLLAHELAHIVQQSPTGSGTQIEGRAEAAAARVTGDSSVPGHLMDSAPAGLYRQAKEGEKAGREVKFKISPDRIAEQSPLVSPSPSATNKPAGPEMPSRIPLPGLSTGSFSLGLRLGFPELSGSTDLQKRLFSGAPDVIKESLQRAKIMNQTLTGKVPTGWEATDKGVLAKAAWGIFSNNIAPGLASKITSGLSTSTKSGGPSYELDLVLITDFSKEIGGGASLTVRW